MRRRRTKSLIAVGFIAILCLFLAIVIFWVETVRDHNNALGRIVNNDQQRQIVFTMRDAVLKRAISLFHMASMEDPFARDEEYMKFKQLAETFISARSQLLESFGPKGQQLWDRVRPYVVRGSKLHEQAVSLILADKSEQAKILIQNQVIPAEIVLMKELTNMLEAAGAEVGSDLSRATKQALTYYSIIALLGAFTIVIGVAIAFYVMKRTTETENSLYTEGERLRSLYKISSAAGVSPEQHIIQMLEFGCRILGMEIGEVCRVDEEAKTNTIISVYTKTLNVREDSSQLLQDSFSSLVCDTDKVVAINHTGKSEYSQAKCYKQTAYEAYIGVPTYVCSEKYGVLSFSNRRVRKSKFSETEEELVELIANWVSFMLEQHFSNQKLLEDKNQAEIENRGKSEFLANMSHEIEAPITAIIRHCEVLIAEVKLHDHLQYQSELTNIKATGMHLLSVISDILNLSKFTAGEMQVDLQEIDLFTLVSDVFAEVQPLVKINNNSLQLHNYSETSSITTDPKMLRQILITLLTNAAKFTEQGKVVFSVKDKCIENEDFIEFKINDTGKGMSKEQTNNVFNAFSRSANDAANMKSVAGGLGVAIAQQMCQILGGKIDVSSTPDQGTTFIVMVPTQSILHGENQRNIA